MNELFKKVCRDRPKARNFSHNRLTNMYFYRLTDKIVRLFKYNDLPFPQHELEFRALMAGYAGVVRDEKKGIMTAWGGRSGPTQYEDYFTQFTYAAPTAKGGTKEIGRDCVILRNTSLTESFVLFIERYAMLFAHNDLSLMMALVNTRYQDIIKVTDPTKNELVTEWYEGLFAGKLAAIVDDTPMSEFLNTDGAIKTLELNTRENVDFTRYTELENELTRSFYRELGVRWNKDKKANLVSGEVEQDNMLLRFNVSDMLKCREQFCEDYEKAFGKSLSVKLEIAIEEESDNANIRVSDEDGGGATVSEKSDETDSDN